MTTSNEQVLKLHMGTVGREDLGLQMSTEYSSYTDKSGFYRRKRDVEGCGC